MKKNEKIWCRWEDGSLQQLQLNRPAKRGWHVTWLTGPLKGKPALIETQALKEMRT